MSKENSFLNNECMQVIQELSDKHPNNMDFGGAVRAFINTSSKIEDKVTIPNQLSMFDDGGDHGDVDEYEN